MTAAIDRWWLLGLAIALAACRGSATEADRCLRQFEQERFAEAAPRCERAFRAGGQPRLGLTAARAWWELERDDDVLRLVAELEHGPEAAGARYLRGRILLGRGQRDAGYVELRAALAADVAGGRHGDAARAAAALADALWKDGRLRDAIAAAEQVRRESLAAGDLALETWALVELGDLWADVGDPRRAAVAYRDAAARRPENDRKQRAAIALKQARLELDAGNLAIAGRGFADGLADATASGQIDLILEARINLAEVAWRDGRFDDVAAQLAAGRAALPPGPRRTQALPFNEARLALVRDRLDDAGRALDEAAAPPSRPTWAWRIEHLRGRLAEARGQLDDAAAAYQRAIAIVEELRSKLGRDELKASFLDERRRAHEAMFALALRRDDAVAAFAAMEQLLARTFVDAFVAAARDDDALHRLDTLPALVRDLGASPAVTPRPSEQVLAAVRGAFVLAYVEADGHMYCVVIAGGRPRPVRLPVDAAALARLIERWVAAPDDDTVAAELGAALLPAAVGRLPAGLLHVVPSGAVAGVPFAALLRDGRRLIEDHDLAMVPSVGVLARLLAAPVAAAGPPVVLGDPSGDLPAARAEAEQVARRLGVDALTGRAATRRAFAAAGDAAVLHVATHSAVGPGGGRLTLADATPTTADIFALGALGLRPRVVVLASCASAVTHLQEFWGSLGAAFLAAGSRTVVASLWSVDDAITAELVAAFYDHGGATAPAAALAAAQRALAVSRRPVSAWAAFVLLGSSHSTKVTP